MVSSHVSRFLFAVSWNLPCSTAMLISRLDGMVSYAFGRCRIVKDKNDRSITDAGALIISFSGSWSMPHCSQQDYPSSETHCRLLYVGSDLGLLKSLRTAFDKPEYHIVSCPDRLSAEM